MEKQQVIFFRNLFLRALVVGVLMVISYFVILLSFWDTWVSLLGMFKLDEQASARIFVDGLFLLRILIAFFIIIPIIVLHWTSKSMKD